MAFFIALIPSTGKRINPLESAKKCLTTYFIIFWELKFSSIWGVVFLFRIVYNEHSGYQLTRILTATCLGFHSKTDNLIVNHKPLTMNPTSTGRSRATDEGKEGSTMKRYRLTQRGQFNLFCLKCLLSIPTLYIMLLSLVVICS